MSTIPKRLRRQVVGRASGFCEYCQTSQAIVITMEIDHIIPQSADGNTTMDNLCLTCTSCNNYKGAHQIGTDPETGRDTPLFNPRTQIWQQHFQWAEDGTRLLGLTETGRATIQRLRINRQAVFEARKRWVEAGWHPPK